MQDNNNKIDFSALDGLSNNLQSNTNNSQIQQPIKADIKLYSRLQREQDEREKIRSAYTEYQDNIRKAGRLRVDINKDIATGVDPCSILLKAIECISLMTGDKAFYTANKGKLRKRRKC